MDLANAARASVARVGDTSSDQDDRDAQHGHGHGLLQRASWPCLLIKDTALILTLFHRLLFAVRAAAEIAFDADTRRQVSTLFDRIDKSYRSETEIARKTTMEMWKVVDDGTGDDQGLDFERFLRRNGCYVPAF